MNYQFAALKYLKSLVKSIESDNIEVYDFSVTQGEDVTPYDIEIKMTVEGFTIPLYNLIDTMY